MRFTKYQALGNDYLVLNPESLSGIPTAAAITRICNRQLGLGSDGILYPTATSTPNTFRVRIFNPDGSEAEKSGNGLRIFARYLVDHGQASVESPITIQTLGGPAQATVFADKQSVRVQMGKVSFLKNDIPLEDEGPNREILNEPLEIQGQRIHIYAASIGNPHCVMIVPKVSASLIKHLGPMIEHHPRFPQRTNVHLLTVRDRHTLDLEIWERGAGYTLSSGTCACAAAAIARRVDLCEAQVQVCMPGGSLKIQIHPDFSVEKTGPVARVGTLELDPESLL
ncbi:MAG TPA: diaminopimelate epimerase [Opitutales bacterium]|nr:diaminopimelate epimerase [Opitutales bacterium]